MKLPVIHGAAAFDAEFDWQLMAAFGIVEGHLIGVGIQQAVITFYKDQ